MPDDNDELMQSILSERKRISERYESLSIKRKEIQRQLDDVEHELHGWNMIPRGLRPLAVQELQKKCPHPMEYWRYEEYTYANDDHGWNEMKGTRVKCSACEEDLNDVVMEARGQYRCPKNQADLDACR